MLIGSLRISNAGKDLVYRLLAITLLIVILGADQASGKQISSDLSNIKSLSAQYLASSRNVSDCQDTLNAALAAKSQSQSILSRAEAANDSEAISISRNALTQSQAAVAEARRKCAAGDMQRQDLFHQLKEEIHGLKARDRNLTADINRDITAVRRLGFNRRAKDFEDWEKLGIDAQHNFENEFKEQLADILVANAQDNMLHKIKNIDDGHLKRLIGILKKENNPGNQKMLKALQEMLAVGSKGRAKMLKQVSIISTGLVRGLQGARAETLDDWLNFTADFVCDAAETTVVSKDCHLFESDLRVTIASVYNNVARRVAINEVNRLTVLTNTELTDLNHLDKLLIDQVRERNQVRAALKELESASKIQ